MGLCRCAFSWALRTWLSALCTLVSAQMDPGQGVGDLYVVRLRSDADSFTWVFVDEKDNAHKVIPNVQNAADLPWLCRSCVGAWESHWHGGALHTVAGGGLETDESGTVFGRHVFAKWEEGRWHFLGTYRTGGRELLRSVPCDEGRFIVVSGRTDLFDDKRPDRSPFCRMSVQEGREELRLDASIDHGQDDLRKHMSEPDCFQLALGSSVAMTEGRATLVNQETGLYWVFSTETARLVKAGGIFRKMAPERMAKGGNNRAILCVNPEKSGTVLLSAQDEDLLLAEKDDAHGEYREMYDKVPLDQTFGRNVDWIDELYRRKLEEAKGRSPLVVWYRIYPENGRVEKLPVPPEGGTAIRGVADKDYWRPMPDGSVRMGWDPHFSGRLGVQASKGVGEGNGETAPKKTDDAASGTADGSPPPEGGDADGGAGKAEGEDRGCD